MGVKELAFAKVRSKELKIFNILRAYELKFEPNLGAAELKILRQILC